MAKGNGAAPSDDGIAIERELSCKLTDDELRMRGDAMADAELLVDMLKAERRAVNKKIFAATDQRNKLAHVIDAEEEPRVVVCKWIADFEHNLYNLIRQDTGDQVEQRTMSAADRQGEIAYPSDPGGLPVGDENGEVHADELGDLDDAGGLDTDDADDMGGLGEVEYADGSVVRPARVARDAFGSSYGADKKPKRKAAAVGKSAAKGGAKAKPSKATSKTKSRRVHA